MNLDAIRNFQFPVEQYEVIVVDNNSTDDTCEKVNEYIKYIPNLFYLFEPQPGVSYARNKGCQYAKGDIIIFLDDDAIPHPDFMERAEYIEQTFGFDAWGGRDIPYFPEGKLYWLKSRHVAVGLPYEKVTRLRKNDYIATGIMAVKRSVLEQIGGFNGSYGPVGNKTGFGEDTELVHRMKQAGMNLGFDPKWQMRHCILPHKYSVAWFLKSAFIMGPYIYNIQGESYSFLSLSRHFIIGFLQMLVLLVLKTPKLWLEKDYYIENWVIDVFRKFAKRLGIIHQGLIRQTSEGVYLVPEKN